MQEESYPVPDQSKLWAHDCDGCIPLGPFEDEHAKYDLYFCGGEAVRHDTVIARFGSDGPEYMSGMEVAKHGTLLPLAEARHRAGILGLLREADDVSESTAERPVQ